VFVLGHKSVFVELKRTLIVISILLFLFLTIGLYKGIRIKNDPLITGKWQFFRGLDIFDVGSHLDVLEFADGIVTFILSLILWLILSAVLLILILVLANVIWGAIFILGIIVYWVFYRAFRLVFLKSRICQGNLVLSLRYSLWYTFLYTGWIYVLVLSSRYL